MLVTQDPVRKSGNAMTVDRAFLFRYLTSEYGEAIGGHHCRFGSQFVAFCRLF
jgi:hypothetical protein